MATLSPAEELRSGVTTRPDVSGRKRPRCRRCGRLLSLFGELDEGTGEYEVGFTCGMRTPDTDEEFWSRWDGLPGDNVARLERYVYGG